MTFRRHGSWLTFVWFVALTGIAAAAAPVVTPSSVDLQGNFAQVQLVVQEPIASGDVTIDSADLTSSVKYTSSDPLS